MVIAMDGRALGVPPFGLYNNAFLMPKGIPILICTARRFDVLLRFPSAEFPNGFKGFAKVEFIDSQGATPSAASWNVLLGPVLQTALIPIKIAAA